MTYDHTAASRPQPPLTEADTARAETLLARTVLSDMDRGELRGLQMRSGGSLGDRIRTRLANTRPASTGGHDLRGRSA